MKMDPFPAVKVIHPVISSPSASCKVKLKGEVVPVLDELNTTSWGVLGSGCIDPHLPDLGISWR
jgi:hypothetical protein